MKCPTCRGSGRVRRSDDRSLTGIHASELCHVCSGGGEIDEPACMRTRDPMKHRMGDLGACLDCGQRINPVPTPIPSDY